MNLTSLLRAVLWPFSVPYGALARLRAWLYARGWLKQNRLRGTVISIGNLTAGGTGKTPLVLWLAQRLLRDGQRVAILSRGYRGAGGSSDEVDLMRDRLAGRVAFGIGKDRYQQGKRLEAEGIQTFLLDDGFQHLRLARDVDIVLVDATLPIESESCLPSGRLREPLRALNRADIVVLTRASAHNSVEARDSHSYSIFYARTRLLGFRRLGDSKLRYVSEIGLGPFFAFCGIGNPHGFFFDLKRWHVQVAGTRTYRDHHRYSPEDVRRITAGAKTVGATGLVTTEKDASNLKGLQFCEFPVYVAVIEMQPTSESEFMAAIERTVEKRRGERP